MMVLIQFSWNCLLQFLFVLVVSFYCCFHKHNKYPKNAPIHFVCMWIVCKHLSWTIFTCCYEEVKISKNNDHNIYWVNSSTKTELKNTLSCIVAHHHRLYHHHRQLFSCERSFMLCHNSQCRHKIQNEMRSMRCLPLCFLYFWLCSHWKIRAWKPFFFFFLFVSLNQSCAFCGKIYCMIACNKRIPVLSVKTYTCKLYVYIIAAGILYFLVHRIKVAYYKF